MEIYKGTKNFCLVWLYIKYISKEILIFPFHWGMKQVLSECLDISSHGWIFVLTQPELARQRFLHPQEREPYPVAAAPPVPWNRTRLGEGIRRPNRWHQLRKIHSTTWANFYPWSLGFPIGTMKSFSWMVAIDFLSTSITWFYGSW